MKVLFIGGNGNISSSVAREIISNGDELTILHRGKSSRPLCQGAKSMKGDYYNQNEFEKLLENLYFDVVVNWIIYSPKEIERDIAFFKGKCGQYIFISSASAYKKPLSHYIITEGTPLANPYWEYSRKKIQCERLLEKAYLEEGFPMTIVRPSHTYNDSWLPTAFASADYTAAARMLAGKEIIIHGDGQSLWVLTHADDFAAMFYPLLGNTLAIGEAYHITGEQVLSWQQIHQIIADSLGVKANFVCIPSDFIAKCNPQIGAGLLGDKMWSVVFDNSKIKRLCGNYQQKILFHQGVQRSLAWYDRHPEYKKPLPSLEKDIEAILKAWYKK